MTNEVSCFVESPDRFGLSNTLCSLVRVSGCRYEEASPHFNLRVVVVVVKCPQSHKHFYCCNSLKLSVFFLFMFLYLYYFSLSAQSCLLSLLLIPRFCQFMHSCSPVMSLCFYEIWARAHPESASLTIQSFPDFWYFLRLRSLLIFWNFPLLS